MATARTDDVTTVSDWKKPDPPLELPSGKKIRCRRSGFRAFITAGIIPNSLLAEVQEALATGVEPDLSKLSSTEDSINEMMTMVDGVVCFVALNPQVHPAPKSETARKSTQLYVDEIGDEDKMFIFQFATGGTSDLTQFRTEFAESVAAIPGVKALASSTKPATRSRKR